MSESTVQPVPVLIVGEPAEKLDAADFGSWATYVLTGTAADIGPNAQRILPQSPKRKQATIRVGPGLAGNANGSVRVGAMEQVMNGQGGQLFNGASVIVQSQPEIWLVGDGTNSLSVTVLDERYV